MGFPITKHPAILGYPHDELETSNSDRRIPGWWFQPAKYDCVSDDEIPNGKKNMFQATNQWFISFHMEVS